MVARTSTLNFSELQSFLFQNEIYLNASTSIRSLSIHVSGHREDLFTMLDLILQLSLKPTISQDSLSQQKEIVLREISERKGSSSYILHRHVSQKIFESNSYSRYDILGTKKNIAQCTVDDIQSLHEKIIKKSQVIVAIAGGVSKEIDKIQFHINKHINLVNNHNNLMPVNTNIDNRFSPFKKIAIVHRYAHKHVQLSLIIPCEITLKNRASRLILLELLFWNPGGILYNRLRNELGVIYSLNAIFDISTNSLTIDLTCEVKHINLIIKTTTDVIKNYREVISKKNLEIVSNISIKRGEMNKDDPEFRARFTYQSLMEYGKALSYTKYIENIKEQNVGDINKVLEELKSNLKDMKIIAISSTDKIKSVVK